ncbi:signal transduction histidine kinase/ligand-binding sensor domain-containing protein [Sphingomonas kyeonggiensis]|uniref:Signal transduction histidine kinase/ligand-binding sensor domain-containing protein n=1 Tax=Sphingomonas kyeonggiensis TaxID=1268553 RepID=A0A7W7K045_9SPHN|nr:sensor histidine kinase [Sphingomonas kyeonggiensis]MBB4838574.1 signal transduction histidine kinase/ligand-binding sensor domain-containing protein [Sphingomonas kyeonggiensis]
MRLALLIAGFIALCFGGTATADAPGRGIGRYLHATWTSKDGVPAMVQALAQGPDGYIWVGTGNGLFRFDGVTFEYVPPAPDHPRGAIPISALLVTRRGELWAAYVGGGGVEIYRGGRMVGTGMHDAAGEITELREDKDGAIWAVGGRTRKALKRYRNGAWETIDQRWGLPDKDYVSSLATGRDGSIWVATDKQLYLLRHGNRRFEAVGVELGFGANLALDPEGNMWLSDAHGTRMLPDYPAGAREPKNPVVFPFSGPVRRTAILFDRDGNLWGSSFTSGIFQIERAADKASAEGNISLYRTENGLTSNQAVSLLQDREGNIWVGTELGLDQFRPANLFRVEPPADGAAEGYMVTADDAGTIWLASGPSLYRALPGQDPSLFSTQPGDIQALCRGGNGSVWLSTARRMVRMRGGQVAETIDLPGAGETYGCAEDGLGRLWVARFQHGALVRRGNGWHQANLPLPGRPQDIVIDRDGNPVIILDRKGIVRVVGTTARGWTNDQIGVSGLTGVYAGRDGMLVAGGEGLALWRNGRFDRLSIADHPWLRGVRGLVQTASGETWMVNNIGLLRIHTVDLDRAFSHPRAPIPHDLFDEQDGFASRTQRADGPQIAAGGDGRLWFLTRQSVMRIDPGRLSRNAVVPPVAIRALVVDGKRFVDPSRITLPRGESNLSIEYTGLSFSVPSRVRFRYMLEGVDRTWVDPGTRRQAFYTNLEPGSYRFRVIASNNDGIWNPTPTTLEFTLPPTFFQSRWFTLLCILGAIGLFWLFYQVKVRALAAQMRDRMRERLGERERIARELHDTLLQGVQALVLRFQLVADDISPENPARRELEEALDRADNVLAEGRDRVRDLRLIGGADDIEHMILEIARKQVFSPSTQISVVSEGEPRPLDPLVWDEVARIANEALFNIWRHAHARQIAIRIGFQPDCFSVRFRDDGVGITDDVLRDGKRDGHFGLPGMRERAAKIQSRLVVQRPPAGGTEIILIVPAAIAYSNMRRRKWRALVTGGRIG